MLRRIFTEIDELSDVRERLERGIAEEPPALGDYAGNDSQRV